MSQVNFEFPVNDLATAIAEKLEHLFNKVNYLDVHQPEKFLTSKETAALLKVSLPTLIRYTQKGKLNAFRIGVRVLYKRSDIEAKLISTTTGRAGND